MDIDTAIALLSLAIAITGLINAIRTKRKLEKYKNISKHKLPNKYD